ncbi:MAG: 3-deoxy-8-phosphooctulonate synthase [Candidatus Neomarinimicrobiota bacterium]
MNKVQAKDIFFGNDSIPFIGGPCVIESRDHCFGMAEQITDVVNRLNVPFIFKSSFDKANRTSISSFRGNGIEGGLRVLEEIKKNFNIPVTTDIHLPEHANEVCDVVDIIQIPAFLCRQTDLLIAAAKTGKVINIKKGQFLSPYKVGNIIKKIEEVGNKNILITERGNTFGFDSLVTDLRSIPIMRQFGYPVIFDATHSAQIPGNHEKTTRGNREFIPSQTFSAVSSGADGIFMEVHDDVENALSDASTQWPINKLEKTLKSILAFRETYLKHG